MAEAIDVTEEEIPLEEREVGEEDASDSYWDEMFYIYMPTSPETIETPGETFGTPMTRGEKTIVTRDVRRIKERILSQVLDGYSPDAGPTSRAFLDVSEVRTNSETGRVLGISFAGMDVIVTRASGRGYRETVDMRVE